VGEDGHFGPVANAVAMLDQRWVLLVFRELIAGRDRFNQLQQDLDR
jgi:DNA-binding HxlR family transcriptional regulator